MLSAAVVIGALRVKSEHFTTWMGGRQCRPWSDVKFFSVWSVSVPMANTYDYYGT